MSNTSIRHVIILKRWREQRALGFIISLFPDNSCNYPGAMSN
ncbi:MAG TPA: hypothetical protein VF658_20465 [Pyrinomonadaceae bacterium]|jgi:hypothetical protein